MNVAGANATDPIATSSIDDYATVAFYNVETSVLANEGTITGALYSYFSNASQDEYVGNGGVMHGTLYMSDNAAVEGFLVNSGEIFGGVEMNAGDDIYRGLGNGVVFGEVAGGAGNDRLIGSAADDALSGGADNDFLRGRDGYDVLGGDEGDDRLHGEGGEDILFGDAGDDYLFGGSEDDELFGGTEVDFLYAGAGDDRLTGGAGRDVMLGGAGRDVFVFEQVSDSPTGSSTRDAVRDFQQGEDLIDLDQLSAGNLSFLGTGAFTGTKAEVRTITTAGGSTVVSIDTDADGVQDMQILVQFVPNMVEADFVL